MSLCVCVCVWPKYMTKSSREVESKTQLWVGSWDPLTGNLQHTTQQMYQVASNGGNGAGVISECFCFADCQCVFLLTLRWLLPCVIIWCHVAMSCVEAWYERVCLRPWSKAWPQFLFFQPNVVKAWLSGLEVTFILPVFLRPQKLISLNYFVSLLNKQLFMNSAADLKRLIPNQGFLENRYKLRIGSWSQFCLNSEIKEGQKNVSH